MQPRRCTVTHLLDEISQQAHQQFKQSLGGAQPLTFWMRCYSGHISNSNKAQKVHSHSHTRQDFIVGMSAIQTEPRRCIATHKLDEDLQQTYQQFKWSRSCIATHSLDGISWWAYQQLKWAQEVHSHLLSGWDFIVSMSAIQMKPRRCIATHFLDRVLQQTYQQFNIYSNSHTRYEVKHFCVVN